MLYERALEEVWEWKEACYEELKNLRWSERVKLINEEGRKLCEKFGLKWGTRPPEIE